MMKSDAMCRIVEEQISAYIDGELPASEIAEVQHHLESCPACRSLAEQERGARTLLRARRNTLRAPAPEAIWQRVQEGLDQAEAQRRRHRRWFAVAASLALLAIGVGAFYSSVFSRPWEVIAETVDDHIRYALNPGAGLDMSTSDPESLSRWFQGRLDIGVKVPSLERAGLQLRGGRVCYLLDRRIAYLMYEKEGRRYSLFVMDQSGVHFPRGKDLALDGHRIYLSSYKGYNLAVWEAYGLLYSLVADQPPEHLAQIAAAALRS
jgi:anti-sigma factor RsiW